MQGEYGDFMSILKYPLLGIETNLQAVCVDNETEIEAEKAVLEMRRETDIHVVLKKVDFQPSHLVLEKVDVQPSHLALEKVDFQPTETFQRVNFQSSHQAFNEKTVVEYA
jgi:hypothetical protein